MWDKYFSAVLLFIPNSFASLLALIFSPVFDKIYCATALNCCVGAI